MSIDQALAFVRAIGADVVRWGAIVGIAFMFRPAIRSTLSGLGAALSSLANRAFRLPGGVQFDAPAAQKAPASEIQEAPPPLPAEIANDPFLASANDFLAAQLANVPLEQQQAFLIRQVLSVLRNANFYHVYSLIFGSQLTAMRQANLAPAAGLPEAMMRATYDQARMRDPFFYNTYAFEPWAQFLTDTQVMSRDGGTFRITPRGKSFLTFLVEQSLSESGVPNNALH